MTDQTDTGEPAFPSPDVFRPDGTHHAGAYYGMTLRQYAAIHLRYPDSGAEWLDDMIRQSQFSEFVIDPAPEDDEPLYEPPIPRERLIAVVGFLSALAALLVFLFWEMSR